MDKRTVLAIVLAIVVILGGFLLQSVIWPPEEPPEISAPGFGDEPRTVTESDATDERSSALAEPGESTTFDTVVTPVSSTGELRERVSSIETDLFIATLSNRGGELQSLKIKGQLDGDEPVDMVFTEDSGIHPFFVTFGTPEDAPTDVLFEQRVRGDYSIQYSREFLAPAHEGVATPFILTKTYRFVPGSYMFELEITIENSVNEFPNLDFNGFAYTLGFGPQIGPRFESLGGRGEFRNFYTYEDGRRKNNRGDFEVVDARFGWAGIVGKYFALLAIADDADYTLTFHRPEVEELPAASFIYLSRPVIRSSKVSDAYRIYAGPKTVATLRQYNDSNDNPFGLSDRDLDKAVDSGRALGWLESILKFFLDLFYRMVPNYGVAILLLTIFVKILLFPITRKSYESTSKMQAINPQISEIRAKYKDNPNRMNQEMAALYKREKVSPLGGCLPMLLQMPIFFAMYRAMSSHFALRGAPFLWWISDLSEPETILNFAPAVIPLLGWSDIRLLPILFVGTQVLSSKTMQQPGAQTNKNMKMMTTLMPVFFFFILYNVPSGLLLYWITTNVLTSAQQKIISYYRSNRPNDGGQTGGSGDKGPPVGKPRPGGTGSRPGGGKPKPKGGKGTGPGGTSGGGKRPGGGTRPGGGKQRPGGGKPKSARA